MKRILPAILLAIVCSTCQQDEVLERNYPVVRTQAVTDITPEGALFSATFERHGDAKILQVGFIWSASERLNMKESSLVRIEPDASNQFSARIASALELNVTYWVQSFAITEKLTVYGNKVQFFSLGSLGPQVTGFYPESGIIGDTIVVLGKNFNLQSSLNKVKMDTSTAQVLQCTDTTLMVRVPASIELNDDKASVSVTILGNLSVAPAKFTLLLDQILPAITGISKTELRPCDTITIRGRNLIVPPTQSLVFVNGKAATILGASKDSIVFWLNKVYPETVSIRVETGPAPYLAVSDFDIKGLQPRIESILPGIYRRGDTLTLTGQYFPTCDASLSCRLVGFSFDPVQILSRTDSVIRVRPIPNLCFGDSIKLIFKTNDVTLISPSLLFQKPAITAVEPNHGAIGDTVLLRGTALSAVNQVNIMQIISVTDSTVEGKIQELYSPSGALDVQGHDRCNSFGLLGAFNYDPPSIINITPDLVTERDVIVTIDGVNFSPLGHNALRVGSLPIDSYQLLSQSATQITFPANLLLLDPKIKVQLSDPVVIMTGTGQSGESTGNLTVDYDAPFEMLPEFPGIGRSDVASFVLNGKGYVGLGFGIPTPLRDLWELDPVTETWQRKADYPGSIGPGMGVACAGSNSRAYFGLSGNSEWWEYDPGSDIWSQKADFPGLVVTDALAFELNGKIFVGGGRPTTPGHTAPFDFWEYDPGANSWTQRATPYAECSRFNAVFAMNGKGYLYSSTPIDPSVFEYIYDPIADSWTYELQTTWSYQAILSELYVFDNYAIIGDNNAGYSHFIITPETDSHDQVTWMQEERARTASFVIDGIGFEGMGTVSRNSRLVTLKDFFKFDPSRL